MKRFKYKIILILIFLIGAFGKVSSQPIVEIFTMPTVPNSGDLRDFDEYHERPTKIFQLTSGSEQIWNTSLVQEIQYKDISNNCTEMFLNINYKDNEIIEKYRIERYYENGKLSQQYVFSSDLNLEVNKKELIYVENHIFVDVSIMGKLKEKYIYEYSDEGLLISYSKKKLSSRSGDWEDSFIRYYFYDNNDRLINIKRELPSRTLSDEYIYTYYNDGRIKRDSDRYSEIFVYNNDGMLISKTTQNLSDGEFDNLITTINYNCDGKINNFKTVKYKDGNVISSSRHLYEY